MYIYICVCIYVDTCMHTDIYVCPYTSIANVYAYIYLQIDRLVCRHACMSAYNIRTYI